LCAAAPAVFAFCLNLLPAVLLLFLWQVRLRV
jgi:hypothetical protein